jgi:surfeit locus 1 family protein
MTGGEVDVTGPRFPIGLTLATIVVFLVCSALGVWQLQRADWKARELARISALEHAPPTPIDVALARFQRGEDVSFTRVVADCLPGPAAPAEFHMISDNGDWIARTLSPCRLAEAPFGGIVVDRGYLRSSRGSPNPPTMSLPAPGRVVGVLYTRAAPPELGLTHPAPFTLVAEAETPPVSGVTPTPYPDAVGNLQYAGAYAPTWFGLAAVLACVYAAMLWRRTHPKPNPSR